MIKAICLTTILLSASINATNVVGETEVPELIVEKEPVLYLDKNQGAIAIAENTIYKEFELTFYSSLPKENGGYTQTYSQKPLVNGVIASNYYPIGTKIVIDGTTYIVEDKGGSEFDKDYRLDMLVERLSGENDDEYYDRVQAYGRKLVNGFILK